MRPIRPGDRGPAVTEIRSVPDRPRPACRCRPRRRRVRRRPPNAAVRAFQQSRGLSVDGRVGAETWRALDAARWRLGARTLYHAVPTPLTGEDVRSLQERLLEMGYDVGRADAIYGIRTSRAVAQFQREVGLTPDGSCGPHTMDALRRLGRKVVGGRPQWLRESDAIRQSGTGPRRPDRRHRPGARRHRPRRGGAATGRCAGPRPDRSTTWPAGWRGGSPPPACGCTSPGGRRRTVACPTTPTGPQLANDARRRRVHLAAPGRPRQPGRRGRGRPTTTAPTTASPRRPGSGWPGWCSGRSSPAPGCGTAAPTPRAGTCCG